MNPIFFTDTGQGTPLVLLHGFCETHSLWQYLIPELSNHFRVLCPDLPGFGQSPLLSENFTLESVASQLTQWLKDLGIDKCIVIGHSLGGYLTLAMAEMHPEMLQGIGLFHSTAFEDTPEKKANRNRSLRFVEKNSVEAFTQASVPHLFWKGHKSALKNEIKAITQIAGQTAKETVLTYTLAMRDRKSRINVLASFSKPILFIAGEEDASVPIEKVRAQANIPKQPVVHIFPQTAHMGMVERPQEAIAAIKAFMDYCINTAVPQQKTFNAPLA